MSKFKLGDRVKSITNEGGTKGKVGTVIVIDGDIYGVEFDENIGWHDCNGSGHRLRDGKWGYCKWFSDDDLEKVEKSNESIVIYRKDQEVIALDKSTGKKAVAKCSPEDTFDFKVGAKLAFERLMYTPKIVKQDKYKVGDKVKIVDKWLPGCHQNSEGKMDKYLGTIMTIRGYWFSDYKMVEDNGDRSGDGWLWNNLCIEGKVVEETEPKKVEEPVEPVEPFPNGTIVRLKEEYMRVPKGCLGKVVNKNKENIYIIDFGFNYGSTHNCDCLPDKTGLWVRDYKFEKVN